MSFNSASSINTFNNCPRKYFFKYKQRLPEKPNINTLGGSIVHQAIQEKVKNPDQEITEIFEKIWETQASELNKLGLTKAALNEQYFAYRQMALNWEKDFDPKVKIQCEKKLFSGRFQLIGFIDEIIEKAGKIILMENKTSKFERVLPEHKLQLAIYVLLFKEAYGRVP